MSNIKGRNVKSSKSAYYEGVLYRNYFQLEKITGLGSYRIRAILDKYDKNDLPDITEEVKRVLANEHKWTVFGKTYPSLWQVCENFGLRKDSITMYQNYRNDKDTELTNEMVEETIHILLQREPLLYNGVEYGNLTALASALNLDVTLISARIFRGSSLEEAIESPFRKIRGTEIVVEGKTYDSIREACNAYGFSRRVDISIKKQVGIQNAGEGLSCLIEFIKMKGIDYPKDMISNIPAVYYNGEYFPKLKDFYTFIGTDLIEVKHEVHLTRKRLLTKKEVINNMPTRLHLRKNERLYPNVNFDIEKNWFFFLEEFIEYAKSKGYEKEKA